MRDELGDRQRQFEEEIRARQRNIVWPDKTRNARTFNALLWHGTARPTMVQRIGMLLIGTMFAVIGLGFLLAAVTRPSATGPDPDVFGRIVVGGISALATYAGFRMWRNALRR